MTRRKPILRIAFGACTVGLVVIAWAEFSCGCARPDTWDVARADLPEPVRSKVEELAQSGRIVRIRARGFAGKRVEIRSYEVRLRTALWSTRDVEIPASPTAETEPPDPAGLSPIEGPEGVR